VTDAPPGRIDRRYCYGLAEFEAALASIT